MQAAADEKTGASEPYEIKRLIIGKQIRVDEAFAKQNEGPVPSPFAVTLPTGEDFLTVVNARQGGFLKATFATPERDFLESIHFVEMDVPTDLEGDRMAVVAKLMSEKVFPAVTEPGSDAKLLAIRERTVGGVDAVEIIGRYTHPEEGLVYVWLDAMPHPTAKRGVYAISVIHHGRRPLVSDADFKDSLAGRTLESFRYIE